MKNLISLCFLAIVVLLFRDNLESSWRSIHHEYFPCTSPLQYSIGTFDAKFGIPQNELIKALADAENFWESAAQRDLFAYTPTGDLKINLLYDNRQDATVRLKETRAQLDARKETYEDLKSDYTDLKSEYLQLKEQFVIATTNYTTHQDEYNKDVDYWNNRGGAPTNEYAQLEVKRTSLDQERQEILKLQATLNSKVDELNRASEKVNIQVSTVNEQVSIANKISTENGDEFEEGEFRSSPQGQEINIYQYDSYNKLVRLLVHELGHSLGMNHVNDPEAIMYRLNEGTNLSLTKDDRNELYKICRIQQQSMQQDKSANNLN